MNHQPISHLLHRTATVLAVLLLLALTAGVAAAQPTPGAGSTAPDAAENAEPPGVLLLVRTPQHLGAALQTAAELRAGEALQVGRIEVIVCGQASAALTTGSDREPALREAVAQGVTVTACGMSLENSGIDPATLLDVVRIVPNGLIRALQLQAEGYLSVEL